MNFIKQISGKPGSGVAKTVFRSGAVSEDLSCSQFFMTMQDRGSSLADAKAYAAIGPALSSTANWPEINRILDSFPSDVETPEAAKLAAFDAHNWNTSL